MNRRSFFGASATAVVAGPAALKEVAAPAALSSLATLGIAFDSAPLRAEFTELAKLGASVGHIKPPAWWQGGNEKTYVYRTGRPAIDCLRSVSGVHRERLEKRGS